MNKKHIIIITAGIVTGLQSLYSMEGHRAPARAPRPAPRCTLQYTIHNVIVPAFVGACCGIAGGAEGNPNPIDYTAQTAGLVGTVGPLCFSTYHEALPGASFLAAYAATRSIKNMLLLSSES